MSKHLKWNYKYTEIGPHRNNFYKTYIHLQKCICTEKLKTHSLSVNLERHQNQEMSLLLLLISESKTHECF